MYEVNRNKGWEGKETNTVNEKVTLLYGKGDLKYGQATLACKLGHLGCQV